ncbi:hypothetical protein ACLOJK_039846 [Asimina triloba]
MDLLPSVVVEWDRGRDGRKGWCCHGHDGWKGVVAGELGTKEACVELLDRTRWVSTHLDLGVAARRHRWVGGRCSDRRRTALDGDEEATMGAASSGSEKKG